MKSLFLFFSIFWFIVVLKRTLSWLYLWQLKDYHLKRFLAHFETYKGKKLIFDPLLGIKIALVVLFLLSETFFLLSPFLLFIFYFSLTLLAFKSFFGKRIKRPVLTKKVLLLLIINILVISIYPFFFLDDIFWMVFFLLIFDIFIPVITSLIVLMLQPLTFFLRKRVLKKAEEKIKENKRLITIGITGSYGKSSTKEILSSILSQKFNVLKTEANQNSEMGISNCILNNLKKEHQIFVCEMGAYTKGGIKMLTDIAHPKMGILTGINQQHVSTFGSQEKIIEAKYELIENLPRNGLAFFNGDNKYCLDLYNKTKMNKLLFSSGNKNADIWAEEIEVKKDSLSFNVKGDNSFKVEANLIGKTKIENLLSAILCSLELGMEKDDIQKGIKEIRESSLKTSKNGFDILDSSYSSNPEGVLSNLEHLKLWEGKKIVVMPCLIELGSLSKEIHKKIGEKIKEVADLSIITTKDRFKEIKEVVGEKALLIEDPREIAKKVKKTANKNSVVLLEGRVPSKTLDYVQN